MVLPMEETDKEVVVFDSMIQIHNGRIAAWKAFSAYFAGELGVQTEWYVTDLSLNDERLDDISLQSFNRVRNSWQALFTHWRNPGYFVTVQGTHEGSIYTYVTKQMTRFSDNSQARLF